MTLRCRPRAGGDPYAAARRCGRAGDNRNLGGYGSPPSRGRQRIVPCHNSREVSQAPALERTENAERAETALLSTVPTPPWPPARASAPRPTPALRLPPAPATRRLPS